ncbi:MAG TPA: MBL fold metallo-hydrolase [Anaerolineae bacterium]|nr:MBL fold metallo-hydrolase [Anaerolineae bacterium]
MAQITLLGTGSAWSGPGRENTYFLVRGATTNLLIDCAGSPAQRLAQVGVSPAAIDHIILTHNHPDHIYGFPILMLNAWMAGRKNPLHVYGLKETVQSARALLRAVDSKAWPNFFKIKYHTVTPNSIQHLPQIGEFDVAATSSVHFVPTIALRVTERATGRAFAYSADTSPNPNIVEIAREAHFLLHEATTWNTPSEGHSSASEAGVIAAEAHVDELILLHVPPSVDPQKWREAAQQNFHGRVSVASDFDTYSF